ncbi:hypothetical protein BDW62DRAFT_135919 [Aspergillus aurantiobrunneus]
MAQPASGNGTLLFDPDGDMTIKMCGVPPKLVNALASPNLEPTVLTNLELLLKEDADGEGSREQSATQNNGELYIRVSSKHLTLSSPSLARIFRPSRSDPRMTQNHYPMQHARGSSSIASIYMLAILHNRNHLVPRSVSLTTLTDMASLVNRYGCYEAIKGVADNWIDALVDVAVPYPTEEWRIIWVMIAWVFRRNDVFTRFTRDLILESTGRIASRHPLAIPRAIVDMLNQIRARSIQAIIANLHAIRESIALGCLTEIQERRHQPLHTPSSNQCVDAVTHACNTAMTEMGLLPTGPQGPLYDGYSIAYLVNTCYILGISEGQGYMRRERHHMCSFQYRVIWMVEQYQCPTGLDMNDPQVRVHLPRTQVLFG